MPSTPYFAILFKSIQEKDAFKKRALQLGYGGKHRESSLSYLSLKCINALISLKKGRFDLIFVILRAIKRMGDDDFNELLLFIESNELIKRFFARLS